MEIGLRKTVFLFLARINITMQQSKGREHHSSLNLKDVILGKELRIKSCLRPSRGPGLHCSQFKDVIGLHDLLWTGTGTAINIYVFAGSKHHCSEINTLSTASAASLLYHYFTLTHFFTSEKKISSCGSAVLTKIRLR